MTTLDAEQQDALVDQQFKVDAPSGQRLRREMTFIGGPGGKLSMPPPTTRLARRPRRRDQRA
jgi:hypothetical protein